MRKAITAAFDIIMRAGQEQHRRYFGERLGEIDQKIADLAQRPVHD